MSAKKEPKQPTGETISSEERALLKTQRTEITRLTRELRAAEQERAQLAVERDAFVAAERTRLCARLVSEGGQAPAVVWRSPDVREPATHLARLSLAELRQHVDVACGARPKGAKIEPPRTARHGLTDREIAICREAGCDPAVFAALKARREAAEK